MTKDQVINAIRKAILDFDQTAGKQTRWARHHGLSPEVVSMVLNRHKAFDMVPPSICAAIGVERVIERSVTYKKVKP